ncbi:MAG: hypothetical protein M3Z97_03550 [Candidatus Dormibacteraeota bacterium]|nr:hypothetical protein [Candidatus Dormibacteraeota bacterium]
MLSPDGAYTWNGREWVPNVASTPTVSPDGRYIWNGREWVPNVAPGLTRFRKEPTSWTRPLQLAIIALNLLGDVNLLTLLPYLSRYITEAARRSVELSLAAQPQDPNSEQVRAQTLAVVDMIGTWVVIVTLVFAGIWLLLLIIGTLRRWTWFYWLLMVLYGLSILAIPQQVLQVFGIGTTGGAGQPLLLLPLPNALLGLATACGELVLFIWMIVAYRKYGPWASRRVPAN